MYKWNKESFDQIAFREEFNARHRLTSRFIYILLVFIIVLFSAWDMFVIGYDHPSLAEFVFKRYLIAMPLLFVGIAFTFVESDKIRMDWLMSFACMAIGISVVQIYILFHEINKEVTIDGYMLYIVSVYFVPTIFAFQKILIGLFSLIGYLFVLWVAEEGMSVFLHALIFLGLINVGGIVQSLTFDKKLKENFISQKKLQKMAHTDHLTGAHNRHKFDDDFNALLSIAKQDHACLGLYIVDIDLFKEYNDHYGHLKGDECLVSIAQTLLSSCTHRRDQCIRFGGEEFILVKYGHSINDLEVWGQELLENVRSLRIKHEFSSVSDIVTVSIGAAFLDINQTESRASLMAKADKSLYKAKESGRNRMLVA